MTLDATSHIDAHYAGNAARFINHSCNPNAATEKWDVDGETHVAIVARRDIRAGEEITFDYQFVSFGLNLRRCLCGEATCRGYLGARPDSSHSESLKRPRAPASVPGGRLPPNDPDAGGVPIDDDDGGGGNAARDQKLVRLEPLYEIAYDLLYGAEPPYPSHWPKRALPFRADGLRRALKCWKTKPHNAK